MMTALRGDEMISDTKYFTTLDAYVGGFLTMRGFQPELVEERSGKIALRWPATGPLYEALHELNSDVQVPAMSLLSAVKSLKGRVITLKKMRGNENERSQQQFRR